ncbi:MAG: extracellular solute-binding protein [Clostridia bacterium]|nr:extracellular solute-binding protein [Clostridia bacterium]
MKTKAKRLLAMLLAVLTILPFTLSASAAGNTAGEGASSSPSISDVSDILDMISYAEYQAKYEHVGKGDKEIDVAIENNKYVVNGEESTIPVTEKYIDGVKGEGVLVPDRGTVNFTVNVPKEGKYTIKIVYCQEGDKSNSIERIFYLNGAVPFSEARSVVLTKVWQYDYIYDKDGKPIFKQEDLGNGELGNDIRPNVLQSPKWITYYITDANGFYAAPFEFYFQAGENTISFESQREPVRIQSITLCPAQELDTYEEYLAKIEKETGKTPANNSVSSNATHTFQAETPDYVSAVTMYPVNDRTSPITMGVTGDGKQSSMYTKLNTAGKEKWQNVGEWMEYTISGEDIKESGFYTIAVRYKQALLSGMYVSRRVYINGEVLFEEANNCRFPYADKWTSTFLNKTYEDENGKIQTTPLQFYFEAGKDVTIRLEVCLGDMTEIANEVSASLANINASYLEILKLTGSTPDSNRNYGFARVMPDVLNTMMLESIRLKGVYEKLVKQTGGKSEKTSTIEQVYLLLEKMARDESEIAGNLATLKSHIGSLGTWINSVKSQPLQVDAYTLQSANEALPRGEANFFVSLWFEIRLFFASFVTDYSAISTTDDGVAVENRIQVWVVTGRDQAQIIRNLVDNKFTPQSGNSPEERIKVDLKLVSGGTLLPSVLAGVGPDVSLMESSTMIIDYALRNAVIPLNQFMEDNAERQEVMKDFPSAAIVPLTLYNYNKETGKTDEIIYGLPDSLSFSMMFYRKDVLASLGYSIDDIKTWDDLLSILPVLQYNNMEIGIANDIYTFIYQSGNEAYTTHEAVGGKGTIPGMQINFGNRGVLDAFTKLCNLYTQYSLPYQFDFANRFRTGEMPIGISAYTTCNQLAIFASELSGLWGFVPLPGYEVLDENGNNVYDEAGNKVINNTSMATVTGCVMLRGCDNFESSWEFMKWYVSDDFQVDYSDEIVSIVGIASRPATANRLALQELPWTSEEWENINEQFDMLSAVPNHPGSYYLARYVNFAFLAAYNDGKDPADALLSYVPTINKEITRKREEFDMYTFEQYQEDLKKELERLEKEKKANK